MLILWQGFEVSPKPQITQADLTLKHIVSCTEPEAHMVRTHPKAYTMGQKSQASTPSSPYSQMSTKSAV